MKTRGLAVAVAAFVGFCQLAHATEIVVLIDGNRMDVKSYEIQTQVVVVTTWDGKVQSFQLTWVDLEATKNASHQYDPTEGIPPERLQKARMLLDAYGVRAGVSGFFEQLEVEIRSIQAIVDRPTYDVVRGSFRAAFDGERVFDVVVADPPAFVKSKRELKPGIKGYRKLVRLAADLVSADGMLFVASCSHHVDQGAFAEIVRGGLRDAHRGGRILYAGGAGPDHPVHPYLPESAYLKGMLLQLD